jgi:hypothetical protein
MPAFVLIDLHSFNDRVVTFYIYAIHINMHVFQYFIRHVFQYI